MKDYSAELTEGHATSVPPMQNESPRMAGKTAREAILANATNREVLALVRERHPNSLMTERGVAAIRCKMKRQHPDLTTSHGASRGRGLTVGAVAEEALLKGATNAEVVATVRARFPQSTVTNATVSSYRNALRKAGVPVLTNWEARAGIVPAAQPTERSRAQRKVPTRTKRGELTIGSVVEKAIRAGATDAEALATVRVAFPSARTTPDSIAFYRSRLRSAGEAVPTSSEIKRSRAVATPDAVC